MASELESISWCDASLCGLQWSEDGRDLVLRVRAAAAGSSVWHLYDVTCRWSEALELSLVFAAQHGGCPLTWDGAITGRGDGTYSVELDFASKGSLRLVCNEIDVQRVET